MSARISKELALSMYACCRQAERSLDFALGSSQQWQGLLDYYEDKRRRIQCVADELERLGGIPVTAVRRLQVERHAFLRPLLRPFRRAANSWRSSWQFPEEELVFLRGTLEKLLNILKQREPPTSPEVIDLRMDLHACETLIEQRLVGVADLEKARRIEHFGQADHLRGVRLDDFSSAAA
jgi:hypothetical protein